MGNSGHACFKPDELEELDDDEIIARIDRDALRWLDAASGAPVSFAVPPAGSRTGTDT